MLVMQRPQDNLDANSVRQCGVRTDASAAAKTPSSQWTGFICSASARAPRRPRATLRRQLYPALGPRSTAVRTAARLPPMTIAAPAARADRRAPRCAPRGRSALHSGSFLVAVHHRHERSARPAFPCTGCRPRLA